MFITQQEEMKYNFCKSHKTTHVVFMQQIVQKLLNATRKMNTAKCRTFEFLKFVLRLFLIFCSNSRGNKDRYKYHLYVSSQYQALLVFVVLNNVHTKNNVELFFFKRRVWFCFYVYYLYQQFLIEILYSRFVKQLFYQYWQYWQRVSFFQF